MPIAFVEVDTTGFAINSDTQVAIDGLAGFDYEIRPIRYDQLFVRDIEYGLRNGFAVGSIRFMKKVFSILGVNVPDINFPEELADLQNRSVFQTTLGAFRKVSNHTYKAWIKPVETKLFDAFPCSSAQDLNIVSEFPDETEIWFSPNTPFVSEWRCFVHKGDFIHWANYSGDCRRSPDFKYVDKLVNHWSSAPVSCVIDVGVCKRYGNPNAIVECGDFWAVGAYGLTPFVYTEMLIDRYKEILRND